MGNGQCILKIFFRDSKISFTVNHEFNTLILILKNKTIELIFKRESLFLLILFLVFYLVKTQFQNIIIFSLDQICLDGMISNIFYYNYTGELVGCEEVLQSEEVLGKTSTFFFKAITSIFFCFSLSFYMLLLNRIKKNSQFDYLSWIYLTLFSFHLFDAVQFFIFHFNNLYPYILKDKFLILLCIENSISMALAFVLFFKYMNPIAKFQSLCIGLPSAYIGIVLWSYVGKTIMPVVVL